MGGEPCHYRPYLDCSTDSYPGGPYCGNSLYNESAANRTPSILFGNGCPLLHRGLGDRLDGGTVARAKFMADLYYNRGAAGDGMGLAPTISHSGDSSGHASRLKIPTPTRFNPMGIIHTRYRIYGPHSRYCHKLDL